MSYTHIAVIVDRSGSMWGIKDDMIGGLTEFFKGQADVPGDCLVDYSQFDSVWEQVYVDAPVSKAKVILEPRGGTALLDAIGKSVNTLKQRINDKPKDMRPDNVLVVIVTDGQENQSREFKRNDIKKLIADRESNGWEFVFLGANIDAVAEAASFGIKHDNAMTYTATNNGVANSMASLNLYAQTYRGGGKAAFSDDDRKKATE